MVSKPDPNNFNGVPMSTGDIDTLNRVIKLITHYARSDQPQKAAVRMYEEYKKEHPEETESRDRAIASCSVMSVVQMLNGLVEALKNAKSNG